MEFLHDYFDIQRYAVNNNFIRTICNIRFKIKPEYIEILKLLNLSLQNNILNHSSFSDIIEKYPSFHQLREIKFCKIDFEENITTSLINISKINLVPTKTNNLNDKVVITFKKKNENSEKIFDYLINYENPYYKNIKRKNKKTKQSIFQWKVKYLNKTPNNKNPINKSDFIKEEIEINGINIKRNIITNIYIENDKIITGGRTLLPGTILFTFENNCRISFKNEWIQLIPSKESKNNNFENIYNTIKNLLNFVDDLLGNIKIVNIINSTFHICDFIYKIDLDMVMPHVILSSKPFLKSVSNCYIIRGIKNKKEFEHIYKIILENSEKYKKNIHYLNNLESIDILHKLSGDSINNLIEQIFTH